MTFHLDYTTLGSQFQGDRGIGVGITGDPIVYTQLLISNLFEVKKP